MRSLAYIDQTLYANEETRSAWRNDEVLTMLREIRQLIVDDVEPPLELGIAGLPLPSILSDPALAAALAAADAYLTDPAVAPALLEHVQLLDRHSTVMINALLIEVARARRTRS